MATPISTRAARMSRGSLGWRVAVSCLVVASLVTGSLRWSDDAWPFGPMSQYAFSPADGDTVVITRVEAAGADGVRRDIPLRAGVAGIGRAEVEAQIPAIVADPSLLQPIAERYARRHPHEPPLVTIWLVQDVTTLESGVLEPGHTYGVNVFGLTVTRELATWTVR